MATGSGWAHQFAFLRARGGASKQRGAGDETPRFSRMGMLLPFGGGALGLAVVAAIVYTVFGLPGEEGSKDDPPVPAEYIYLDNHRVDAYVGQMENGSSDKERRSSMLSRSAEAKAHGGQVLEVGGSVREDRFVERVVTRTAADRVFDLRQQLRRDDWPLNLDDAKERDGLAELKPGDFVELQNAQLKVPTYTLPLPKLAYASRNYPRGQDIVRQRALTDLIETHPEAVNRYLRTLDPDPRIPAVVKVPAPESMQYPDAADEVTIFLPLRYSKLSDAPGMMAGLVNVFGKVISTVEAGAPYAYFDVESELAFGHALRTAPRIVRDVLHIGDPAETIEKTAAAAAPGLVIVPLAVFY